MPGRELGDVGHLPAHQGQRPSPLVARQRRGHHVTQLLLLGLPLLMRSVRLLRQVRRTTTMLPAGLLAPRLGVCEREGFDDMAGKDELLGGAGF